MQPLEVRRAADREALHRGGASGAGERFGEYLRGDARFAKARPDQKNDRWLAVVGLLDVADRAMDGFSKGMRQRAKVAAALVSNPAVLILDEPTTA